MVYAYIRVSTDKQTVENQRHEILRFAHSHGWRRVVWVEETISGTKAVSVRKLGSLLSSLKAGDVLLSSELSRLGRSVFMILGVLQSCLERRIEVYTVRDNFHLGNDVTSKVLAFAFGLSAEIERDLISQRTKEALAVRRRAGLPLGRPYKLESVKSAVAAYLLDHSVKDTAVRFGVVRSTVYYWLRHCGVSRVEARTKKSLGGD